jgi:hypothetical protein
MIGTGNHWGNTQWSNYVRPVDETECNGQQFPPGHLRRFDYDQFRHIPGGVPAKVRAFMDGIKEPVILNCFFHRVGDNRKIVHGWIIVTSHEQPEGVTPRYKHGIVKTFVTGPTWKSHKVLECCSQWCAED